MEYNVLNANNRHVYCMSKIFSLLRTMHAKMGATKSFHKANYSSV